MMGTCALCQNNADLQDSHLIPMWAYRRICDVDPAGPKAPVYIAGGSAVLSNRQTKQHLLCADCEQRFSISEDHLAKITSPDNGQIKLFRNITRLDTPRKVLASLDHVEDADHLAYFVASVVWRGCVMSRGCKLGLYEHKFRQYLLGETQLPRKVVIFVGLLESSLNVEVRGWVSEPASTKTSIGWLHGFLLVGLAFRCLVGKAISPEWQNASLAGPHSKKYVSMLKPEKCADFLAAVELVGAAVPRGKLANR